MFENAGHPVIFKKYGWVLMFSVLLQKYRTSSNFTGCVGLFESTERTVIQKDV